MSWKFAPIFFSALSLKVAAFQLSGFICDEESQPVSNLAVTFTSEEGEVFEGRTNETGEFVIEVGDPTISAGQVVADPVETITNGFALPDEITWTSGQATELPNIELEEIKPQFTFERRLDGTNCLRFEFDWVPGATAQTLRSYCVERSTDLFNWDPVMNVGMACPPVEFIDETAPEEGRCYYRIFPLPEIVIPTLPENSLGLIADPNILPPGLVGFVEGWIDNTVIVTAGPPLVDGVPIIAPEIRLVPAPEE